MNLAAFPNLNDCWAALIIEELIRNGVDTFCVSPGSRSAPLTMAVANNARSKSIVHFDERGSAFYALGFASAAHRPCAVITTSGTAAANLFPAIVEASKKKLPLIILTADRPPELRATGAAQTIDQVKIFGEYIRWFYDVPCPTLDISPEFVLTTVDQAVFRSKGELSGPVHLNCMYREPLAPAQGQTIPKEYFKNISAWQNNQNVYTSYSRSTFDLHSKKINAIFEQVKRVSNGIIVAGKLGNAEDRQAVLDLSERLNWPVFPDISSGLRLGPQHKNLVPYFDQLLLSDAFRKNFRPDSVLHLGGRLTSKRWHDYIDTVHPDCYVMVLNHPLRNDPLHCVTHRIQCRIPTFCKRLAELSPAHTNGNALASWSALNALVHQTTDDFLAKSNALNDIFISRLITEHIPQDDGLFCSNSMPIRELDMYGIPDRNSVTIGANRGASGIDGIIATAAGFCAGRNKRTTVLIGDLAFLYDLNSLALLRAHKLPMVLVVLNNNGGGIFSFLPVSQIKDGYEKYFGTPHHLTFRSAAELFGLDYAQPESPHEFVKAYTAALKDQTPMIIEVLSDRKANLAIHTKLQTRIQNVIDAYFKKNIGVDAWRKKPQRAQKPYAGRRAASTPISNTKKLKA